MAGGIVIAATLIAAEITVAPCAGRARRTWSSAVCRAIVKKIIAVFAQRNRRDDGARPLNDRPAPTVSKVPTLAHEQPPNLGDSTGCDLALARQGRFYRQQTLGRSSISAAWVKRSVTRELERARSFFLRHPARTDAPVPPPWVFSSYRTLSVPSRPYRTDKSQLHRAIRCPACLRQGVNAPCQTG